MTIMLPSRENPMLLFGCGNMGGAMLAGWLKGGFSPDAFVVVDPIAKGLPVATYADAGQVEQTFSLALLAIKPQLFTDAAGDFARLLTPDALVISILAGTRLEQLQLAFPGRRLVRLMPNLAAALGKSPLGLFPKMDGLEPLLTPLGKPVWLSDEGQMDTVTALAGSGPAFVYRFIEALSEAGAKLGLPPEQAQTLAIAMVDGAAQLAATSDIKPAELARRVTSPGGTTAAGLAILDDDDALKRLIDATLKAARDRGVELSQGG